MYICQYYIYIYINIYIYIGVYNLLSTTFGEKHQHAQSVLTHTHVIFAILFDS